MTSRREPEVLVVGAGPTGLAMAAELTRHGVGCRIVDEALVPSERSKALAVQPRTLEVLGALDLAERLVARGVPMHGFNAYAEGEQIVHVEFDDVDTEFPYVLIAPQSEMERVLEEHLDQLGVKVERGVRLE